MCASKFWPKNTVLHCLNAYTTKLTNHELDYLTSANLDFSIMSVENSTTNKLWLGPGAYVNHDCMPNSKLYANKLNGAICLQTISDIPAGVEITWKYGADYFRIGECQCVTCESNNVNKDEQGKNGYCCDVYFNASAKKKDISIIIQKVDYLI